MARRSDAARVSPRPRAESERAFLYVEGPRDREIVLGWAERTSRALAGRVQAGTVILGGRQPARAREHLREAMASGPARGLCVLDRDQELERAPLALEDGLETFVWSRRHIESYLLVPSVLGRLRRSLEPRAQRALLAALPGPGDERAWLDLDAKRALAASGQRLAWGRLARAMQDEEIHPDVRVLLERLGSLFGVLLPPPRVRE